MISSRKQPDRCFNVAVVGDKGVGKGAFMCRLRSGEFTKHPVDDSIAWTTSPSPRYCVAPTWSHLIHAPDDEYDNVLLEEWADNGTEICCYLSRQQLPSQPIYDRKIDAAIIMFDIASSTSFDSVKHWQQAVRKAYGKVPVVICGNKADLLQGDIYRSTTIQLPSRYLCISVKKGTNVDSVMPGLIRKLLKLDKSVPIIESK